VETGEIKGVLEAEVLKREVLEGEKADAARKQIAKAAGKALRASKTESPLPTSVISTDDVALAPSEGPE
jgi:hypothetical protein